MLQQQVGNVRVGVLDHLYQVLQKKEQMEKEGKAAVRVVPLTDLFYDHTALYDKSEKGNRRSAVIILGVGVLILLIAGINFVNFSMSLAPTRMKGINTHKVLGATAGQLRRKLMIEAILYSLTAFMLSVGILGLFSLTPAASLFSVSLDPVNHWRLLGGGAVLAVVLGMMAGFYPAVYVTSFEPAVVLKGSFVMAPQGIRIRNGLMVFQFMVSITLIICTLLIGAQYRFMQNYSVGYRTENIVWLPMDESLKMNREALADEMLAVPGVLDYTFSETVPGLRIGSTATQLGGEAVHFDFFHVYKNYLDFFGIPVVKGEGFSVTKLEEAQLVVNEMALMKQPVVENFLGYPMPKGLEEGHLKGVISDMHYMPLKQAIGPMALVCSADADYRYLYLKLSGTNVAETLHGIQQVYEALSPTGLFEFRFLEGSLQQNYESEKHLTLVISLMGFIAIVLALVGVYGLIIFNAQYKRKEIGIRKVNGATEEQIMLLLNRNFFRLLLLSFVIACPLAWYAVGRWLEGFCYKTPIHWWMFLVAGFLTLIIAVLTVSWQSWKAATDNPVNSLKSE